MNIVGYEIGREPFIIGEAGLNHGGDTERARCMVWAAKHAGCDAVKFQTFQAAEFCRPNDPMYETFVQCQLPVDAWPMLRAECDKAGILFMSTPQNRSDLDILLRVGIPAIKVGSDDFTNLLLLADYAQAGLPMILSCGMSGVVEVCLALGTVSDWRRVSLLVCTSQYPCPPEEANILRVATLKQAFPSVPIGFSDHTIGNEASIAATALGACIFERHFMLEPPCVDDAFALDPAQLAAWVKAIRLTHTMLGSGAFEPSVRELEQKRKYQRQAGAQLRGIGEPA